MKLQVTLKTNWAESSAPVFIKYGTEAEWYPIPLIRGNLSGRISEDIKRVYPYIDEQGDYGTKSAEDVELHIFGRD